MNKVVSLFLMSIGVSYLLAANTLNMFIDSNRFLDKDKSTILLVDYQIPYPNLVFMAKGGGYFAEIIVTVESIHGDSVAIVQNITDNIGVSNKADIVSKQKTYMNRLSFMLDKSVTELRFRALDINSQKSFEWQFLIDQLPPNAILSDIELNSEAQADTLQYLAKFHRNGVLYLTEPSILINRTLHDFAYLYLEAYHPPSDTNGSNLLNLSLEKDSLIVMDDYIDYKPVKEIESISLKIPLADLSPGKYNGSVTLQSGEVTETRSFEFVLIEDVEEVYTLLTDPDEEYILMRYFLGNRMPADWKNYSVDKKRRYSTQFWNSMATTTKSDVKSVMSLIQERIDYANRHFGSLIAGWKSNMGRVYIRNGAPDDIDRDTSSDQARFVRKDYQIWKYSTNLQPVYVFVDIQMNGNYRLIYADSDDMENSDPDWMRYLGSDFDDSRLDN
ncbi:MAG: GWxTD domain-containing protein [Candidatus Cloacimonetes bacterium]|nr:GWxTD domain-containing protein [Candidatus Cloacimonadota bacterium]